jgi:RNA polymerase sigma-70 factor, ECF subfamily
VFDTLAGVTANFFGWLTELVHTHRQRLVRAVRREGVSGEDALDCVQDAFESFLHLPEARPLAGAPEDAVKLLTVLARNHARNRRRKHDRARPHESNEALVDPRRGVDKAVVEAEGFAMAVGCLDTLAKLQRAVVKLRLVDEVAGQDVARLLGLRPGHVAVLLHRALGALRSCMISAGYSA